MEHKPRPLKQPILSSTQWVRIAFIGLLTAVVTVYLEATFEAEGPAVAATMGFVVFALLSVSMGLSARSETGTFFNRDRIGNSRQMALYGLALLLTFLPTRLDFLQELLGFTSLTSNQWLLAIGAAIALLLVDEVVKFFMRRSR